MPACRRLGSRPEVELANTTSGGAARLAAARRSRFSGSRSGALSWTKSAPSTAASGVSTSVSVPSGGSGASVRRRLARRALSTPSPPAGSASDAGSYSRTSTPLSTKRAAQPPPITPPPSSPAVFGRSATTGELQLGAHLVGAEDADVHRLEDRHGALDELPVRGERPAREVQVVLEADARVAADERGERDVRQLHAADREGGEDRVLRQPADERQQRRRVVRGPVRDAHAELDQRRVVDQSLTDQVGDHHEVAGVEDLELGAHAELADPP